MGNFYSTQNTDLPYKLNWKPSPADERDEYYEKALFGVLPTSVDLRPKMFPVYDQSSLGSCTANAIAACYEYLEQSKSKWVPSRLFIYYNERAMEGTTDTDSGAFIRDGIKSLSKQGVCDEKYWPYDITKFTDQPPRACYTDALEHTIIQYNRVEHEAEAMKSCLAQGYPIVFGFKVYESFRSIDHTGIMPMPQDGEELLGGHAVVVVGYNDDTKMFTIRNSWTENFGDNGYFYMPYEFLLDPNQCEDFWMITKEY